MSRLIFLSLSLLISLSAFAQDLSLKGFNNRFSVVRAQDGKLTVIKLKKATTKFSIKPFIEQIKADLLKEQESFNSLTSYEKDEEINQLLADLGEEGGLHGLYPQVGQRGSAEMEKVRESLLNLPNINVNKAFTELNKGTFWEEFEAKLKEAYLMIDPSVLANAQDPRFFYKKQVTYKVVTWALDQAKKRFSNLPILNIASFVIVRVHDMMLEQRAFHHNMLLHYFETVPETKLGMSKEEVDRVVSSIYEYRIGFQNFLESNKAAADWLNYGMNKFYGVVRTGNVRVRDWQGPLSTLKFQSVKKINFAFADVTHEGARKIYHLHLTQHQFSAKPSLAYDFSQPKRVKRNRSLLNLAGVGLGFINMPGWLKGNIDSFIKSFYVQQVRMEGALIGHFESTGDAIMVNRIYSQRENFYIIQ